MKSINLARKFIICGLAIISLACFISCVNLEKFRYEAVEIVKDLHLKNITQKDIQIKDKKSEPKPEKKQEVKPAAKAESRKEEPKKQKEEVKLMTRQNSSEQNSTQTQNTTENNTYVTPIIDNNKQEESRYESVVYVKSISAAGKEALDLQNSGDTEYVKLISNGFESPKFTNQVFTDKPVATIAPGGYNYLWKSEHDRDQNIYQNVEFNRYNNRLMDTTRYATPAHFTMDNFGKTVVHAPSDQNMQIFTPVPMTMSSGNFLDIEDQENFLQDEQDDDAVVDRRIENQIKNLYSFLE